MSPVRRSIWLALVAWVTLLPVFGTGCRSSVPDKRILQYLNTQGFGKRYVGNAQEQNYVSIGDTVTFTDAFNIEVSGTQRVDVDGTIQLPEVGTVWVAGLTRSELETYLTQKLSPYFIETDVKVSISTVASKTYFVLGEVAMPGERPFRGDLTLFEAVVQATPQEFSSNLSRVRLIRADPQDPLIITADLSDMWQKGDSTFNVQVQEYDIIYVPPTLLKRIADFVAAILVPFTSVFRSVFAVIFSFNLNQAGGNRFFF